MKLKLERKPCGFDIWFGLVERGGNNEMMEKGKSAGEKFLIG